ncbi:hypothetical protein MUK42_33750 [Musa troglodytarum]|uniref:Uncharacterized protein n=1 Tax=Musa troglodytarum TaxID=320322 RepID=A0A9E7EAI7_9LILI|nr:hypothetical protein MUK42_33750 [Musa troglodytarum]
MNTSTTESQRSSSLVFTPVIFFILRSSTKAVTSVAYETCCLIFLNPHESSCTVIAELLDALQRQQSLRKAQLLEQLHGFLAAEVVISMIDLGSRLIVLDDLRCHGITTGD